MPLPTLPLTDAGTARTLHISLDGAPLQIHCNDTGAPTPQAQTVVLLHGSGPGVTGWSNFGRSMGPLADAGYRVLAVTCPGWGPSSAVVSTGSRPELNARVLAAVLDALELQQPVALIGNSMGAHSAVAFALARPERVRRLVLVGGGTGAASIFQPQLPEGLERMHAVYRTPSLDNLRRMLQALAFAPENLQEETVQALWRSVMARPEHLENFVRSLEVNPRQYPDVGSRLTEISAPALLIWGRDDRFVPLDIALRLLAGLRHAELHVIGNCGHGVMMEQAPAVNRMALEFLAR